MQLTQPENIFVIAEIAQAHDGSLGIAHSYIDALAGTGVNAVKFQTHIAEAESSQWEKFRVKFSYEDNTRYDYWRRMEFSKEQWAGLKEHCDKSGLEFLSSPFSNAAVDLLEQVGVKRYKIGSGEITNFLLLEKVARTGKDVILSSGMSSLVELQQAIDFLRTRNINLSLLQCTTAYPTAPVEWGLNVIQEFKTLFNAPIGYSDHSGDIYACLSAAALGAEILEFHVVFDKAMFGPDAPASLTPEEVKRLVKGVRQIEEAFQNPAKKNDTERFESLKTMFGKTLAVNRSLSRGHHLTFEDLESKKPAGMGVSVSDYQRVIGKKLTKDIEASSFLKDGDFE